METNRLRQFAVIVETGSIRKAAELLRLSHGGLSKSLRALEDELKVKLTAPEGRGLKITAAGLQVYEQSQAVLRSVDALLLAASGPAARPSSLRLATSEVFSTYFLKTLLDHQQPGLALYLREMLPHEMERALAAKDADVALTYLAASHPGIDFTKVGTMTMGVYTAANAFAGVPTEALPFALPIDRVNGATLANHNLDGWPPQFFPRQVGYQVTLMESALQLCRSGHAAVYLPTFIAKLSNAYAAPALKLKERPLPAPARQAKLEAKLDVYLATRKGDLESPVMRRLAKAVRAALRSP